MFDLVIEWICSKCSKEFHTKNEIEEHQLRKRGGKTVGCFVVDLTKQKSVTFGSLRSVSISDFPDELDLDLDAEEKTKREEFEAGKQLQNFSDASIDDLIREVKFANDKVINGVKRPHPEHPNAFLVKFPTISFVNGLVSAGVAAILAHEDFGKKIVSSSANASIIAGKNYRDGLHDQLVIVKQL